MLRFVWKGLSLSIMLKSSWLLTFPNLKNPMERIPPCRRRTEKPHMLQKAGEMIAKWKTEHPFGYLLIKLCIKISHFTYKHLSTFPSGKKKLKTNFYSAKWKWMDKESWRIFFFKWHLFKSPVSYRACCWPLGQSFSLSLNYLTGLLLWT